MAVDANNLFFSILMRAARRLILDEQMAVMNSSIDPSKIRRDSPPIVFFPTEINGFQERVRSLVPTFVNLYLKMIRHCFGVHFFQVRRTMRRFVCTDIVSIFHFNCILGLRNSLVQFTIIQP